MEDRFSAFANTDAQPEERGRRFAPTRPPADSEPDREHDPLQEIELEPGWEPA